MNAKIISSKKIILASGSATRKKMLDNVKLDFEVHKSNIDERALQEKIKELPLSRQAVELAKAKAKEVSLKFPEAYVIGGDQICEFDGKQKEKPGNAENAIQDLKDMRGKEHYQNCGAAIYHKGELVAEFEERAILEIRDLSDTEIEAYVEIEKPFASCGSYMLENHGKHLFKKIQGDHDVILGLPLIEILEKLYELKVIEMTVGSLQPSKS